MPSTRNLAILTFADVEVLDFCGPFEVFSVANRFVHETSVAAELGIAIKTTQVYRDSIRHKLGGVTTLEAIRIAAIWRWEQERFVMPNAR